jgi:hypothetical protein
VLETLRTDFPEQLGQFDRRRICGVKEAVVVRQLLHLPVGGFDQLLLAVAQRHAPQAGHSVQDLVAIGVPDVDAVRTGNDAAALGA